VKDLPPVGSNKPSASSLHDRVVKMGRVFLANELQYLHAHVVTSTNGWDALISANKGDEKRASITDDPDVPNSSIDLEVCVDNRVENFESVTPAEVIQLQRLVRDWLAERKDDVAVIDDDEDADIAGGRGADGGGGDEGENVGGCGAGVGGGDGGGRIGGSGEGSGTVNRDGAEVGGGGDDAGTSGNADGGANMGGGGDGGNDATSGTDAAVDNLPGVFRARHPLSPETSEERPIVRRKRRKMCVVSHAASDLEGGQASSETT